VSALSFADCGTVGSHAKLPFLHAESKVRAEALAALLEKVEGGTLDPVSGFAVKTQPWWVNS
jgi:hypothetical protein